MIFMTSDARHKELRTNKKNTESMKGTRKSLGNKDDLNDGMKGSTKEKRNNKYSARSDTSEGKYEKEQEQSK